MHVDEGFDAADLSLRSLENEIANSVTHGAGLALSLVGGVALVAAALRQGTAWEVVGCSVYAASLISVYAASTLSHVFQRRRLKRLFRILDQACIYLLIAGTFTPLSLTYLRDGWGWWLLFAAMWTTGLVGFASKVFWTHRIEAVSTVAYVLMGWMPVLGAKSMIGIVPGGCLWMMLWGGLCYTVGTLFLVFDYKAAYLHAVWHLFVIAGSAWHYFAIWQYVLPHGA